MFLEISNPMDYHVALYIRLSKEDESEGPSQSVTNQQSLLNEFARQHRLSVFDTYIDDGFSGTSFDRPAFRRMIEDIEAKKVNMVVTKDLSRLGRDYIMTGHYMERYFPEKRVRYISLLDGIDTGVESTANDITPFRAIMNDMYAKDISKKIKSVKRDKQRKGQFIGSKPMYGYKMHPTEKNKIVIAEIQTLQSKMESLTTHLEQMYMDRLSVLLSEADFQRVYKRIKTDRLMLEEKLKQLEAQKESPAPAEDRAKELVRQYLASAYSSCPARAASDGDSPYNRGRPFIAVPQ